MNISTVDQIVAEYLIYRGFTQTFRSLESERSKDRTRHFEVTRLVEAVFTYLNSFDIDSFISLWDFLSKRFFFHLDSEHLQYSSTLKSDLLKYYLVHTIKAGRKDRLTDFFSSFSHEILSESGDSIAGGFRGWFVLPYMEDPERDPEFAVYFSTRWGESLRITIGNFLSIVLQTSPPPRLLLLEKWFHADAQKEMRAQLALSSKKVEVLISKLEKSEERLAQMRLVVKDLLHHVQKASVGATPAPRGSNLGLFELDEEADAKRDKARELGQTLCRAAADCSAKSNSLNALSKEGRLRELLGRDANALFFPSGSGGGSSSGSSSGVAIAQKELKSRGSLSGGVGGGDKSTTGSAAGGGGGASNDISENLAELEHQIVSQVQQWLKSLSV